MSGPVSYAKAAGSRESSVKADSTDKISDNATGQQSPEVKESNTSDDKSAISSAQTSSPDITAVANGSDAAAANGASANAPASSNSPAAAAPSAAAAVAPTLTPAPVPVTNAWGVKAESKVKPSVESPIEKSLNTLSDANSAGALQQAYNKTPKRQGKEKWMPFTPTIVPKAPNPKQTKGKHHNNNKDGGRRGSAPNGHGRGSYGGVNGNGHANHNNNSNSNSNAHSSTASTNGSASPASSGNASTAANSAATAADINTPSTNASGDASPANSAPQSASTPSASSASGNPEGRHYNKNHNHSNKKNNAYRGAANDSSANGVANGNAYGGQGLPYQYPGYFRQPYGGPRRNQQQFLPPPIVPQVDAQLSLVIAQIEYYLSVENLCKDVYLRKHMNSLGLIPLTLLASFRRIQTLTGGDYNLFLEACRWAPSGEIIGDRIRARVGWNLWVLPVNDREPAGRQEVDPSSASIVFNPAESVPFVPQN